MKSIQLLRRMSLFLALMMLVLFVGCENPTNSDSDPSPDDDVPSDETPSDADSTSVEITGLDAAYEDFDGILYAFEAGYEFAADALTVASQSVAEASETAGGGTIKISENGFGPAFLESETVDESTDEDIWVDFVGEAGTDYDLYFVVEEDLESIGETVTVIHGGTGEDVQPLYTFSGGSALEITIDASDAGVTEYSFFAGATFNVTGVPGEYQDWDVLVAIFEDGVEPADGAEAASAVALFGEDGTIGATGSAGPLYAFDAEDDSSWAGDDGQDYDVYLFLENDGDTGYESAFVFGPDSTPLKVLSGGSEQTIDVSVPDDAFYYGRLGLNGTGSISIDEVESAILSHALITSRFDNEADPDVWIHGIFLYGDDLEYEIDSLSGTGPLVWIDIDEHQSYDEPQSETYEFGGASDVTTDRGSFVELGVLTDGTLDGYRGGSDVFSDAESDGATYAYHIYDDNPTFDNIAPETLDAGFTGGAPSEGGTLSIEFTADGKLWVIEFNF
jgi:hypothetical protein